MIIMLAQLGWDSELGNRFFDISTMDFTNSVHLSCPSTKIMFTSLI